MFVYFEENNRLPLFTLEYSERLSYCLKFIHYFCLLPFHQDSLTCLNFQTPDFDSFSSSMPLEISGGEFCVAKMPEGLAFEETLHERLLGVGRTLKISCYVVQF